MVETRQAVPTGFNLVATGLKALGKVSCLDACNLVPSIPSFLMPLQQSTIRQMKKLQDSVDCACVLFWAGTRRRARGPLDLALAELQDCRPTVL